MSNSFLALSNTRFTNGGNGRTLVECVLLERISEKERETATLKHIIIRGSFMFAFLSFLIPLVYSDNHENQLSAYCQILIHVCSTGHPATLLWQ